MEQMTLRDRIAAALDRGYRAAGWEPESETNPDPAPLIDAILAEVRAGADDTQRIEGTVPTPGQMLARIIDAPADRRLDYMRSMIQDNDRAAMCFTMDHDGAIEQAERWRRRAIHLEERLQGAEQTIDAVRRALAGRFGALTAGTRPVPSSGPGETFPGVTPDGQGTGEWSGRAGG